ncbi:YhcN/YlaJ family sporulation lipoprotein [Bacillus sp. 2205SS5-2]|uniref:YhcN/YlaJ family sporulation lipoprotein n=1 Tax=Bacillus sp. 2205SS5-2 TaxID=3109031 RepID=UPI0030053DEA
MRKSPWVSLHFFLSTLVLTGCQAAEQADQSPIPYEPGGIYSNVGHGGDTNDRSDGPVTELYDHSVGKEGQAIREYKRQYLQVKDENGNPMDPKTPLAEEDRSFFARDTDSYPKEPNYHGFWDPISSKAKNSYYTGYHGKLVEKISAAATAVENVEECRAVVDGGYVVIGLDLRKIDPKSQRETRVKVEEAVKPYVKNKIYYIDTNLGNFARIKVIDNDLRGGGPKSSLAKDVKHLINSYH